MKLKKIAVMIMAASLAVSAAACGSNSGSTSGSTSGSASEEKQTTEAVTEAVTEAAPKEIPAPKDIEAAIAKALGDGNLAVVEVPADELWSTPIRDVEDMSVIESYVAKQSRVTSLDQDCILVAKCKDAAAAEAVINSCNAYFAQTISYIRQYPSSVAKGEGARLYQYDTTVIFVIGGAKAGAEASEEDAAKLAASEYEKIDEPIKNTCGSLPKNLAVMPADSGNAGGLLGN